MNLVTVCEANFPDLNQMGRQHEFIVKFCSGVVSYIHLADYQHQASILKFTITCSRASQHLYPATLKVVEIVGVMDASLSIGFVVVDADGELVTGDCAG